MPERDVTLEKLFLHQHLEVPVDRALWHSWSQKPAAAAKHRYSVAPAPLAGLCRFCESLESRRSIGLVGLLGSRIA